MDKDEALKMAIEAMEDVWNNCTYWEANISQNDFVKLIKNVRRLSMTYEEAKKEALEQPAQEPVGFKKALQLSCEESKKAFEPKNPIGYLYSNNTWVSDETDPLKTGVPFYTEQIYAVIPCPHPHQWQGLTDDEIDSAWSGITKYGISGVDFTVRFARAIEQALKEKNYD